MKITFTGLALIVSMAGSFPSINAQVICPAGSGKLVLDNSHPETGKIYSRTLSIGEKIITCGCFYKNTDPIFKLEKTKVNVSWINEEGQGGFGRILLDTALTWTKFTIPITYFSNKSAAFISIHFISREEGGGMNDDNNPNRLFLDNFQLLYKKQD